MKKPTRDRILAARPLSQYQPDSRPDRCSVCGAAAETRLYRECDERDAPVDGDDFLVYVGVDHDSCQVALDEHPRLYVHAQGHPGAFPLCGGCEHRRDLSCACPDAKANGGAGITIGLTNGLPGGVICMRGPGGRNFAAERWAVSCTGKKSAGPSTP